MPRKTLKEVRNALKENAEPLYYKVLRTVIETNSFKEEDRNLLLGLIRGRNWATFYREVDAMSGQLHPDAATHFAAHQLSALVKKYPWDPRVINYDPLETAISAFKRSERVCKRFNWKIENQFQGPLIDHVRRYCAWVLGAAPSWDRICQVSDFGSGSSLCVRGSATHIGRKLKKGCSVSPAAYTLAVRFFGHNVHYAEALCDKMLTPEELQSEVRSRMQVVNHNEVDFVPKTAKTHRAIAIEPLVNGALQKGVDKLMRDRLKKVGLDLRHQHFNQLMARMGSEAWNDPNGYATIDLSSASDSICTSLVKAVLDPEWYSILDAIRSKYYLLPGSNEPVRYEKFCSMGNGFCFPLETLIFAGVASYFGGQASRDYRVYGDDIIVRRRFAPDVILALRSLGFKANAAKTFYLGKFRESCGADWYCGEDVRPFTLDFRLDTRTSVIAFLNLSQRNYRSALFLAEARALVMREARKHGFENLDAYRRPFRDPMDPSGAVDPCILPVEVTGGRCASWLTLRSRTTPDRSSYAQTSLVAAVLRGSPSAQPFVYRFTAGVAVHREVHAVGFAPAEEVRCFWTSFAPAASGNLGR